MWFALLTLISCASNRVQEEIPVFVKEKVCSDNSLAYVAAAKKLARKKDVGSSRLEVEKAMQTLGPLVRSCYETEVERTNKPHSFNLCLVAGYGPRSELEFFEFSTKEISISEES